MILPHTVWAHRVALAADLPDERLESRLTAILVNTIEHPSASIPQAMDGDAGQAKADVMKTWPCADFSFIRDLLRILAWHKPVFAGIEPILRTSLGTSPRRP